MKNNIVKKSMAMTLALAASMAVVGCKKTVPDTEETLEIFVLNQGYGTQWCDDIASLFQEQAWVKEKYPDLEVLVKSNDQKAFVQSQLGAGPKTNTFDLLFGALLYDFSGSDSILNLTDPVYNSTVPGEEVLYKDKMNDSVRQGYVYRDINKIDPIDEYYMTPWQGGVSGLLYNEELLHQYLGENAKINTTDELYEACKVIRDANASKETGKQYAFIQSSDATNYWNVFLDLWWAQYDGLTDYYNFSEGIDSEGNTSAKVFERKGRLKGLEVFEKMLNASEDFFHPYSFNEKFMTSQSAFLNGSAVFHANGDWFDEEMKETVAEREEHGDMLYTIKWLRTPIVSTIIEKCPSIGDDKELSALVSAIDAESSALKGEGYEVTQADYDKILEARFIADSTGSNVAGVIPSYATGVNVAIDFLRFMATDIALEAYAKATYGAMLDFDYDVQTKNPELYASLTPIHKARVDYKSSSLAEAHLLRSDDSFPLRSKGNVKPFVDTDYWANFTAQNGKKTALELFNDTLKYWTENDEAKWKAAKSAAGMI